MVGVIIFLAGSALSGIAQDMIQLILFRGIQGLGAGSIIANSYAVMGDVLPPAQRGKWMGVVGAVFALAIIAGPLVGGIPHRPPQLAVDIFREHPGWDRCLGRDPDRYGECARRWEKIQYGLSRRDHPHSQRGPTTSGPYLGGKRVPLGLSPGRGPVDLFGTHGRRCSLSPRIVPQSR